MNHGPEVSKLVQLRAKTERQLVQVIGSRLNQALRSENAALAGKARAEVSTLLPFVTNEVDRHALETKLARLEEELEARVNSRALAAC